jgi:hypothetical protein
MVDDAPVTMDDDDDAHKHPVADDDAPSFTDLPVPIQEKFLSQLSWKDIGGAAATCGAWRDYFQTHDDEPTW